MNKLAGLLAVMAVFFLCRNIYAASESLTNVRPEISVPEYSPGAIILLPDGRRDIIDMTLPEGGWRTREGLIIDHQGILEGSGEKAILVDPSQGVSILRKGMQVRLSDGRDAIIEEILPNGDLRTNLGIILAPDGSIRENATAKQGKMPGQAGTKTQPEAEQPKTKPLAESEKKANPVSEGPSWRAQPKVAVPEKAKEGQLAEMLPHTTVPGEKNPVAKNPTAKNPRANNPNDEQLTLAEMLPLTRVPGEKGPEVKNPQEKTHQVKEPEDRHRAEAREKPKPEGEKAHKKPEPEKAHKKPEPEKKAQPKKAAPHKTPIGQELKIPPEAARNGNLAFLEGCWQGTRPEYFSKRTIRECFCFGPNGTNGKRRVIDPQGGRRCIGASRAHLSSGGVLSVTSEGAACTDGERWGSAEMVCRNSGPKTPCSWVFRDANNGRQAYQIPFIRVESCGR